MAVVVGELVAKLEVDLRNFERKLADATTQIDQAAQRMERSLSRVGETTVAVEQQQKTLGQQIGSVAGTIAKTIVIHEGWTLASKKLNLSLANVASSTGRLAGQVGTLNASVATASAKIASFTRLALFGLKAGLIGVAAVISAKLLISFGLFLDRLGAVGAAIAVTRQGFTNLATTIGETGDSLEVRLRRATLGTVDDFSLLRTGTFSLLTGVAQTGAQFEEMARVATILALAVGKDAAEGFEILTTGIARHSVILLKQLGIVVDAETAYKKYANRLGKTVGDLDANQRSQAFLNAVMAKARENVGKLALDTNNLAIVNAQAAASAINLRQAFAREVAEAPELLKFKKELLGLTTDLRSEAQKAAPAFGLLADGIFGVGRALLAAATSAETFDIALGRILAERIRGVSEQIKEIPIVQRPGGFRAFATRPSAEPKPVPAIPTALPGVPGGFVGPPAPIPIVVPPPPPITEETLILFDELQRANAEIVRGFEEAIPLWDELGQLAANLTARTDQAIRSSGEFATTMARVTTGVAGAVREFQAGDLIVPELRAKLQLLGLTAEEITQQFRELGITTPDALDKVKESISESTKAIRGLTTAIGRQIVFGLVDGIKDAEDFFKAALKALLVTGLRVLTGGLGIFSPSKVTRNIGRQTGEGFALGVTDSFASIQKAFAQFPAAMQATLGTMQLPLATAPAAPSQTAGASITVNADFSQIPQPLTPDGAAVNAAWQRLFSETFRQLQFGGFRP